MASDFRYTRGVTAITQNAGGATIYIPLNGDSNSTTESVTQALIRKAYTAKNLYTYCTVYTGTQTITVALRESGVTSALTDTITATGIFEETTATEALDDGDLVNYILTVADSGHGDALTITTVSCVLSHASADWPVLVAGTTAYNILAGGTYYQVIAGGIASAVNTVEANVQRTARTATTLSNLAVNCGLVGADLTQTLKTRVDGGPGGQSITVNATGRFEDTAGTDSVSVGSEINTSLVTTDIPTLRMVQVLSSSTARQAIMVSANITLASNVFKWPLDGGNGGSTIDEAINQVTQRTTNVLKNLYTYCSAYTLDAAGVANLRINGADSAVTVSVNATGVFEDTTNSVTLVATDEANYSCHRGAATSGAATLQLISVEETQPSTGAAVEATPKGVGVLTASVVPNIPFAAALQRYNWNYA